MRFNLFDSVHGRAHVLCGKHSASKPSANTLSANKPSAKKHTVYKDGASGICGAHRAVALLVECVVCARTTVPRASAWKETESVKNAAAQAV